jgi:hypothetical protein
MLIQGRTSVRVGGGHPIILALLMILIVQGLATAAAQTDKVTQLPITLPTWAEPVRTSACLQVIERRYAAGTWWENLKHNDEQADRAFKAVIAALKHKDRDALWKLSDPDLGREAKQFEQQSTALFQQFQVLEIVAVPLAYEFDGLVVFYPKFRMQGQTVSASLAFAHRQDGTFGYLPYRTKMPTFELVEDWFHAPWGPDKTDHPSYCLDEDVRRATHRVPLVSTSDGTDVSWHQSSLMLRGAPMDARGALADLAEQVKAVLEEMKASLSRGTIDEFLRHLDADGAKRTAQWYDSANDSDREIYRRRFVEQQPFFLFDAYPLDLVYAKTPDKALQVMYFVSSRNDLLWTNSIHITIADKVFKAGPLARAALLEKPFSEFAVK